MLKKDKYALTGILLVLVTLFHVNHSIEMMPLCQICATDDGFSCITCGTCQTYAVVQSGYCQCDTGFYINQENQNNIFCDRCHTSCKTCFGPLPSNCITCSDRFDFVQEGSFCKAPNNSTDQTLIQAYSFYGFSILSGWSFTPAAGGSYATYCGSRSLLGGVGSMRGSNLITLSYTTPSIPYHFSLRVKTAFYILNAGGSTAQAWISVSPSATTLNRTYSYGTTSINNCGTDYIHFNIDDSFPHEATTATVQIGLSQDQWFGIRQFYLIAKKCKAENCSLCTGYLATECVQCVDNKRISTSTINPGTCLCDGVYYQQPYAGQCVDPCPSVPIQYYGDPTTRYCQQTCPSGYFALDDTYRCVTDCPVTSSKSLLLLFKDLTNRKCVSTCPQTQPYAYPLSTDRKCYATCPTGTYATDAQDRRCVATCPQNSTYKLYGHNGKCVAICPINFWADPFTVRCLANCSSSGYPFKDNSTGFGVCVARCPAANFFGQTTNYTCVEICPSGTFGQRFDASNNLLQMCVAKCNSPRWGLVTDNRKCVDFCPQNYWGEPVNRVCTNVPADCNPLFADNYTRTCVAATSCSFGFYGDKTTWRCVPYCPTGTYAHPTSKQCQPQCEAPYFRDPGINACVQVCNTIGTYADVSSTRTCVTSCNITGLTPWADESTRTCVNDCNQTVGNYLSDNTTWKCVYQCPTNYFQDFTTTAPKCVTSCPSTYYADTSTGKGVCVQTCPAYPRKFGDVVAGKNVCVDVCSPNTFGDQTGFRLCTPTCTGSYFAQNDAQRLCVLKCKDKTYGWNNVCLTDPKNCPANYFGDDSTNLCVNVCPQSQGTFGDPESKLCVRQCPLNPLYGTSGPQNYFADISNRLCVLTCNASHSTGLFGNNNTRTCETKCLDRNSFAQVQTVNRLCVAVCLQVPTFNYANNDTQVCGTSINCQANYFGENSTQTCVESCPSGSFAYKTTVQKLCIDQCPMDSSSVDWYGDITTGKRICVTQCPSLPLRFADQTTKLCVETCPSTYYGDTVNRKCVKLCPDGYFAHQNTRRCVSKCPDTFFGDDTPTVRYCHPTSDLCGTRFGDPYKNLCVTTCTGPTPFSYFGSGDDCVLTCPTGTYADSETGTRLCVADCPDYSGTGGLDLYGDSLTQSCVPKCVKPLTWADFQTRDCQSTCSATPIATYSQNFNMRCVISTNCPTSPSMTFGDSLTRSCLSNCTNDQFGDPTTRNCVTQCPKLAQTGTEHYYGDISTGIHLCVTVCPSMPRLFGNNASNLCVPQCPQPNYGDQTGKRSCLAQCPIVSGVNYYAQNTSRICVKVCIAGTWGLESSRQCVEDPLLCGTQWADNTTHMCVTTCPATSGLFADPTTKFCVPLCPSGYFSDYKTRTCVQKCPQDHGPHGTFGNNSTRICQSTCTQQNAFADPQTIKRYCVLNQCSQSPSQSFADPSSKTCVNICPVFPSLFAETQTFTCIARCISPYYGNTNTRRCELTCPASHFKLNGSQLCVSTCPQNPDLYGDSNSGFCQSTCTNNYHRYATDRTCISSCKSKGLFSYNFGCVKFCPVGFYADSNGICISTCTTGTYGQNSTTQCLSTCITGYAQGSLCVAKCDDGLYGENKICKSSCTSPAKASNQTNLCVSKCESGTYLLNGKCELGCTTGSYADPFTNECSSSCTNGLYGDSTTNKCVSTCTPGYYRDPTGYCLNDCSVNSRRADNITWNCEAICSNGTWGYQFTCVKICPSGHYGYTVDRDCYPLASQPEAGLFMDSSTQTWVSICPLSPLRFGDRTKKQCVQKCIDGQFSDPETRQCETSCTNTAYFADSTTNKCVMVCPSGYYANPGNNLCQDQCTLGKFAYQPSHQCVETCPAPYYGHDDGNGLLVCKLECPDGTYGEGRLCVPGCSVLFADSSKNLCVDQCLDSFANTGTQTCETTCDQFSRFADNSTNTCVDQCPSDPDFYQQNDVCVHQCSDGLFADPTPGVRACKSGCTQGLYAEPQSKRCLPSCKPGYFAINLTNQCSKTCPSGQFADRVTGFCQSSCTSPTLADSLLNQCVKICSGNQFGQNGICVSQCTAPNFANPLTKTCESSCPQFDYLFAENTTRTCVKDCKPFTNSFADKNTRKCMSACSLTNQYALVSEGKCVELCPQGLFMDGNSKKCEAVCTVGFAEPTSRFCVDRCYSKPDTYGHIDSNGVKTCKFKCLTATENLYADNRTNLCVQTCTDPMFSDPLSGNCVQFCPQGLYAEQTDRTCTSQCNSTQFADNLTRSCVNQCPTGTEQTFGYFGNNTCLRVCPQGFYAHNTSKQCVLPIDCPDGSWADDISKYCVSRCPSDPLTFGYDAEKICVSVCPQADDLYGEFIDQKCVPGCGLRNGIQTYADPHSRTCVFECPIQQQYWADPTDKRCKQQCSGTLIRDNSTQMCVVTCPSTPQSYADINTKFCVRTCPDGTFASDETDRICTDDCSLYSLTFGDNVTNKCVDKCSEPYFADDSSYLCVLDCPDNPDYYADPHSRTCVGQCPKDSGWVSFADPQSRECVTICPQGSYAVNSTQRCQTQCPPSQYADEEINICVKDCTVRPRLYKEVNNRVCVQQCPTDVVQTFKQYGSNVCVYANNGQSGCPDPLYADPQDKMCKTQCPEGYFAQDSSRMCVEDCQTGFVADPTDKKCKLSCASVPEYYAFDLERICVQHCPAPYYQNNQTYRCTLDCQTTPMMFKYDETRQCVFDCHYPYFAYTGNQTCLLGCPSGFFAQQSTRTCVTSCDDPYFADDSTNKCVQVCPQTPDYYGHLNVCQFDCPDGWYRDNSTRLCVEQCPIQPLLFADNSTNTCVKYCPASQNFFADNITRKCVLNCSVGLFAQVQSRTCLKTCPSNLLTYADPTTHACQPTCPGTYYASDVTKQCVQLCPDQPSKTYAHIDKCLGRCPQNYYGENTTRTCRLNCSNVQNTFADDTTNLCVTTCPQGLFAENTTDKCVPQCPVGSYADPTTRICVQKCPGTQRLFADPSNQRCVSQCSLGYYGDSLEWVCLENCPDTASGYRFDVGRLCVEECPSPYFAFVSTRICVQNCGRGLYGDPVTRTCKDCPSQCPTCLSPTNCLSCIATKYLSYGKCVDECILTNEVANYANDDTRSCVIATRCPAGMYGLNATKKCQSECLAQMYKNITTRRCQNCPQYCSACLNSTHCTSCTSQAIFSQQDNYCYPYCNLTHNFYLKDTCVQVCPVGTYLDYTAVNCQKCNEICLSCFGNALNCTSCYQSFKYEDKCVTQCPADFYGDNAECKPCTPQIQSCIKPLSFSVVQTTQNFQPVLVVKFNQETIINGNPKDFIKVRLSMKTRRLLEGENSNEFQDKMNRRLQSTADMINDGLYFDAEVLPDGSLKLKLQLGQSLDNVNFEVVFTDPSAVQTKSGQTLQSLQAQIELATVQIYPSDVLAEASTSFSIISTILSVAIIVPVFSLLICSPVSIFYQLQAFQLISLFAYFNEIPPNLFYFLRNLKLTRFTFLPNIFANFYQQPTTFTEKIPVSVEQTQGMLSFGFTASGFIVIGFIYAFISGLLYLASSKYNSNRPLRNIFVNIYNTRVKYGALNDMLWIFSINVFVSAFMQFRQTQNGGDVAIGTISLLAFLVGIGFLIYKIVMYHKTPQEESQKKAQARGNLAFVFEGLKEQKFTQHNITIYYIRKILFTLVIAATITDSYTQAIVLIVLQCVFSIYIIAMRPFIDNIRTVLSFFNQIGVLFVPCGIIYFIKIKEMKEPIGHKIICGEIITYVIIAHLCILLIWAYFRLYFFIKELYKAFKETQFYKLYMDEDFENELEKQIKQLDDEENGEVESVEITNYNDKDQQENEDDGDLIIKLKIKRKRIINKNNKNKPKQQKPSTLQQAKRHNKSDYTKLQNPIQESQVKYQPPNKLAEYQKVSIEHKDQYEPKPIEDSFKELPKKQKQIVQNKMRKSIHDEEWTVMKFEKQQNEEIQKIQQKDSQNGKQIESKNKQIKSEEGSSEQYEQIEFISELNEDVNIFEQKNNQQLIPHIGENKQIQINNKEVQEIQQTQIKPQQIEKINDKIEAEQDFEMISAISDGLQKEQNILLKQEAQIIENHQKQQAVQEIKIPKEDQNQQQSQQEKQADQWMPYHVIKKKNKKEKIYESQRQFQQYDKKLNNKIQEQSDKKIKYNEAFQILSNKSEENQQNRKQQKESNNWGDLQNLLDEDDNEGRKEEKKKIQMMIFDDEQF